jgi:hypothetical protein
LNLGEAISTSPLVVLDYNNYRLPAYHRLDVSVTRNNIHVFGYPAAVTLSVVNVYNRKNVFAVESDTIIEAGAENILIDPANKYISQLPILPFASLRVDLGGPNE